MTKRYDLSVKRTDGTWINKVGSVTDWGNDKVQCAFTDKQIMNLADLIKQGLIETKTSQFGNYLNLNGKLKQPFNKDIAQPLNKELDLSTNPNKDDEIPF